MSAIPLLVEIDLSPPDPDAPLEVVSISAPPRGGTATPLGGGRVAYARWPGFSGIDGFSYLARDPLSGRLVAGWATVIVAAAGEPPSPMLRYDETPIPEPARTVDVAPGALLPELIRAAEPGTRLVLPDGPWGDFSLDRPGVQVFARNPLGALVGTVTVKAADCLVSGLSAVRSFLGGDRSRIRRCRFSDTPAAWDAVTLVSGVGLEVDFCEFARLGSTAVRWSGASPISLPRVFRNWAHDQNAPPGAETTTGIAAIGVGPSAKTSLHRVGAHVLENLIERWSRIGVETKSSGNVIEGNHTRRAGGRQAIDVYVRHGLDNLFLRNLCEDGGDVGLADRGCVAWRNSAQHKVGAGEITGDELRAGRSGILMAEAARVLEPLGGVELGWKSNARCLRPPVAVSLEGVPADLVVARTLVDEAQVALVPDWIDRIPINPITGLAQPRAASPAPLTPAMVGPFGVA